MFIRNLVCSLQLVGLAACASTTKPEVAKNGQSGERTYALGSNIPKLACGPGVSEGERRRQVDELRSVIRPPATNPGTTAKGG